MFWNGNLCGIGAFDNADYQFEAINMYTNYDQDWPGVEGGPQGPWAAPSGMSEPWKDGG